MTALRRSTLDDLSNCQAIILSLPDYFTADVPDKIAHDLHAHGGWVVTDQDTISGFAIVQKRSPRAAEILWMAVHADRRHRGLGGALLDHVLRALHSEGVALVEAKTQDASANYEPYRPTRAFWEGHGFV